MTPNHAVTGPLPVLAYPPPGGAFDAAAVRAATEIAPPAPAAPSARVPATLPAARYSLDEIRARRALTAEVFPDEPGAFVVSYKAFALFDADILRTFRAFDAATGEEQLAMLDTLEAYVWDVLTGWNLQDAFTRANLHHLGPPLLMLVIQALGARAAAGEVAGSNTTTT